MKYPNAVRLLKFHIQMTDENIGNNMRLLMETKSHEHKLELEDKIADRKAKLIAYQEELKTLKEIRK
jgi:hypothetical protein